MLCISWRFEKNLLSKWLFDIYVWENVLSPVNNYYLVNSEKNKSVIVQFMRDTQLLDSCERNCYLQYWLDNFENKFLIIINFYADISDKNKMPVFFILSAKYLLIEMLILNSRLMNQSIRHTNAKWILNAKCQSIYEFYLCPFSVTSNYLSTYIVG